MSINFAKNHNPNLPSKAFKDKSPGRWPYADAVVEPDHNIGRIMDKIRALGIDKNTFVFYTSDNGAWQDVAPDAGYTPFRGSKSTDREGGSRVPGIAWWPGRIAAGSQTHEIAGGLDLMATCARLAGVELPKNDREGKPMIFDSHDMGPLLFGQGEYTRKNWFYFTEEELLPGAIRKVVYRRQRSGRGHLHGRAQGRQGPALRGRQEVSDPFRQRPAAAGRGLLVDLHVQRQRRFLCRKPDQALYRR